MRRHRAPFPRLLVLAAAMSFIAGGALLPWSHVDGHGALAPVVLQPGGDAAESGPEPADDEAHCPVCTAMTAGAAPAAPVQVALPCRMRAHPLPGLPAAPAAIPLPHPSARGPPLA